MCHILSINLINGFINNVWSPYSGLKHMVLHLVPIASAGHVYASDTYSAGKVDIDNIWL